MSFLPKMPSLPSLPGFGNSNADAAKGASFQSAAKEELTPSQRIAHSASEEVGKLANQRNVPFSDAIDRASAIVRGWDQLPDRQRNEIKQELETMMHTATLSDNQVAGYSILLNTINGSYGR
jgi:hypothetical protein